MSYSQHIGWQHLLNKPQSLSQTQKKTCPSPPAPEFCARRPPGSPSPPCSNHTLCKPLHLSKWSFGCFLLLIIVSCIIFLFFGKKLKYQPPDCLWSQTSKEATSPTAATSCPAFKRLQSLLDQKSDF